VRAGTDALPITRALALVIVGLLSLPPLLVLGVQAYLGRDAETVSAARLLELSGNTLSLVAIVVASSLLLGTATALLTHRVLLPGRRVWSTLITVPLVLPAYVVAVALSGMVGGDGVVTGWLAPLGVERLPPASGLWAAATCLTIVSVPIVHALVGAALTRADPALEEAARVLGDPPLRVLARITLPRMRGTYALSSCVIALYVISDFGAVSMLRYDTFTRAVYAQFRGRVDLAPAFALCSLLVLLAGVFIVGQIALRGRESPGAPHPRPAVTQAGPLLRVAGTALLAIVVVVSSVLPLATLIAWTVRGLSVGAQPGPVVAETLNTLGFAASAAAVTTALAVPVALVARRRGVVGRIVETVPWVTHSLPHLAIGLALLVLAVAAPRPLYQSAPVLVAGYAVIFLPVAVGAMTVALRGIDPRLSESSRLLGRGAIGTFRHVTVPLAWRAAATGAALVFFATLHELPVTLLLRPTGTETLAVRLWGAMVEGQYTTASIAAVLMVAVSFPLLAVHARSSVRSAVPV